MPILDTLVDFFKSKSGFKATQGDFLASVKQKHPAYSGVDDARLAAAMVRSDPQQYGFLTDFDAKKELPAALVPKELRTDQFYSENPDLGRADAMTVIDELKVKYPEYKDVAPEKLAAAAERKFPDQYKGLAGRINPALAPKVEPTLAEKTVGALRKAGPDTAVKAAASPFLLAADRVQEDAAASSAEAFDHIKKAPASVENKLVQSIVNFQPGETFHGSEGELVKDAALAGIVEFNGFFKGLTGADIELSPESLAAIKERKVSPEIAGRAGEIAGGLALLGGISKILQTGKIAEAVGRTFWRSPQVARFMAPAATGAADFGAAGAVKEGLQQVREGKLDLTRFGKVVLKDTSFGAWFGAVGGIADGLARVAGTTAYGFGTALADGATLAEATVSGSIAGLFAAATAKDVTRAQKQGAYKSARENVRAAAETEAAAKGYEPQEAAGIGAKAQGAFDAYVQKVGGFESLKVKYYEAVIRQVRGEISKIIAPPAREPLAAPETPTTKPAAASGVAPVAPKPGELKPSEPILGKASSGPGKAVSQGTEPDPISKPSVAPELKTRIEDGISIVEADGASKIEKATKIVSSYPVLKSHNLFNPNEVDFSKAKELARTYYQGDLMNVEVKAPAFGGESVKFTGEGLAYTFEGKARSEENISRRLALLPKAREILETTSYVDEVRDVGDGVKRYGLLGRFEDGSVVRVVVQEVNKDGKSFLSVFDWDDVSKKMSRASSSSSTQGPDRSGVDEAPLHRTKKSITQEPAEVKPPETNPQETEELKDVRLEISSGEPGQRIFVREGEMGNRGGIQEIKAQASSYPEYFKNKGLTKAVVLGIIDKKMAGKPLTTKQTAVLDDLLEDRRRLQADSASRRQEEEKSAFDNFAKEIADLGTGYYGGYETGMALRPPPKGKQPPIEQFTFDVTPAAKMPEKAVDAKKAQVEQRKLLEGFKPEEDDQLALFQKRAPKGADAAVGSQTIDTFEKAQAHKDPPPENFKLFEEVKKIAAKYAARIGEKYTLGNEGLFFRDTENVRVRALNNVSTAAHELTHMHDKRNRMRRAIMHTVGTTRDGKPVYNQQFKKIRKRLTDIYVEYYPGGKKEHPLETRTVEGLATFIQKFVEHPQIINEKYPDLVTEFLRPGGRLYQPVLVEMISDFHKVIKTYQELDPLSKVGARVTSKIQQQGIRDTYLNFGEKMIEQFVDNVYPIEKLAREAGVERTKKDPSLWIRQYNNSTALILNNFRGKRGFWGYRGGEFRKISDKNIRDLVEGLQKGGALDDFAHFLVARRQKFAYEELDAMKEEARRAFETQRRILDALQEGETLSPDAKETVQEAEQTMRKFKEFNRVLANDGFDRKVVEQAFSEHSGRFKDEAELFDTFTRSNLNMLADPDVRLITPDQHADLSRREGYASFKRDIYDELLGSVAEQLPDFQVGKTKISSAIRRTGSEKTIINPLYSLMRDHAEIVRKSLKQIVYNRIKDLAPEFPELFQTLPLQRAYDPETKITHYPQEKDPNIIMGRDLAGKRVPILASREIKEVVDGLLTYQNIGIIEKMMKGAARFFTKGTTGAYPFFAPMNLVIDQITAAAQTRTAFIPVYDSLAKLGKALFNHGSREAALFEEYMVMGGERQTFAHWQDLSPDDLFKKIAGERTALAKIGELIDGGMNILALPSGASEVFTRATEYIKSRAAGNPQLVALEDAGRVTAPFHHVGKWGGSFGQTLLKSAVFANPGIQVLAQYTRSMGEKETRPRALFVTLAVIASTVASFAYLLNKSTKEQKDFYKELEPNELANYVWFPNPDGKRLVRVRIPEQMGVLGSLTNMAIADMMLGTQYKVGDYLAGATSFLPDQINLTDPVRVFFSSLPQIIKPLISVMTNTKDWPKVRPLEGKAVQYKEPGQRFYDNTSVFAKWMGAKLNLSPIKIDFLIEGYMGRVTRLFTGKPLSNPFIRDWYFTAGRNVQDYYDIREKNQFALQSLKDGSRKFSAQEQKALYDQQSEIKLIDKDLKRLREFEKEMKDGTGSSEDLYKLRSEILDGIGNLKTMEGGR